MDQPRFLFEGFPVLVRGGGDLGSGVCLRLYRAGFPVVVSEVALPLAVRLRVAFASAVWDGEVHIEGIAGRRAFSVAEVRVAWQRREVPVTVGLEPELMGKLGIGAVIDARMVKQEGPRLEASHPLLIGLGPGFRAGRDCHAVVETLRGHTLGRVYWTGGAAGDTARPDSVQGVSQGRVVRAPASGVVRSLKAIGDAVGVGDPIAEVAGVTIRAPIAGVLRGLLHEGVSVSLGGKIGDIDPRGVREHCFTMSDKALAVGGGAVEAVLGSPQFRDFAAGRRAPRRRQVSRRRQP